MPRGQQYDRVCILYHCGCCCHGIAMLSYYHSTCYYRALYWQKNIPYYHNFLVTFSLDTPLGVACGRNSNTHCIMPLLSGGAHIDFRGKEGLTPMHRGAIGGNAQAINVSNYYNRTLYLGSGAVSLNLEYRISSNDFRPRILSTPLGSD